MTDAFWIALFAGVPPTLAVVISGVVQSKKTDKVATEAREAAAGTDSVASGKLDVIHTLVNNRLSSETRMKDEALARVKELEAEIGGMRGE